MSRILGKIRSAVYEIIRTSEEYVLRTPNVPLGTAFNCLKALLELNPSVMVDIAFGHPITTPVTRYPPLPDPSSDDLLLSNSIQPQIDPHNPSRLSTLISPVTHVLHESEVLTPSHRYWMRNRVRSPSNVHAYSSMTAEISGHLISSLYERHCCSILTLSATPFTPLSCPPSSSLSLSLPYSSSSSSSSSSPYSSSPYPSTSPFSSTSFSSTPSSSSFLLPTSLSVAIEKIKNTLRYH